MCLAFSEEIRDSLELGGCGSSDDDLAAHRSEARAHDVLVDAVGEPCAGAMTAPSPEPPLDKAATRTEGGESCVTPVFPDEPAPG